MAADMATTHCVVLCAVACCGALLLSAVPAAARGGFGEQCTHRSECTPQFAECINNICACNSSNVQMRNKCFLPVGARCEGRTCDADNAVCETGFCVCRTNFIQSENNTYCYKVPLYNEYCQKDFDCRSLSDQGRCQNERCSCSETTAIDGDRCKRKVGELGRQCIKETEVCYLERDGKNQKVECKDMICTCKAGVKPSKDHMSCGAGALEALSLAASVLALLLAKMLT